jgi:hypothetical protein
MDWSPRATCLRRASCCWGLTLAAKPADWNHPYGHGRIETVTGLFVGFTLATAGLAISANALRTIIALPGAAMPPPAPFVVWPLIGFSRGEEPALRRQIPLREKDPQRSTHGGCLERLRGYPLGPGGPGGRLVHHRGTASVCFGGPLGRLCRRTDRDLHRDPRHARHNPATDGHHARPGRAWRKSATRR